MFVNSPNDFPASFNWSRYTVAYSAIPTTLASVETNQEIMIFMDKKKKLFRSSHFGENQRNLGYLASIKGFNRGKRKPCYGKLSL